MIQTTIEVRANNLPRMASRFRPAVSDITGAALFKTLETATPITPVDTGNLRNTAQVRFHPGAFEGSVYWPAPYAALVNGGTRFMAPRPFATDAARIVGPQYVAALSQLERRL